MIRSLSLRRAARCVGRTLVLVSVVAALAVGASSQRRVFVIDEANRPGTDFTDLPPAVAAAVHGDVLIVRDGDYSEFTTDQGIRVLCQPGARAVTQGAILINDLPADQQFVLRGLEMANPLQSIRVSRCDGVLVFEGLRSTAFQPVVLTGSPPVLNVFSSRQVVVSGCEILNRVAVACRNSHVTVAGSTLRGAPAVLVTAIHHSLAQSAISAGFSSLVVSHSSVSGGDDRVGFLRGAAALSLTSVDVTVTGDTSTKIEAGASSSAVAAISGTGAATVDPDVGLVSTGGASEVGTGVALMRREVPALDADGSSLGGTVDVRLDAPSGSPFAIIVGAISQPLVIPGYGLPLEVLLPAIPAAAGSIPASGTASLSVPVSNDPSLRGLVWAWQAASLLGGEVRLSNVDAYAHD